MAEEEMRESAERDFQDYVRPFKMVTLFKYLGQVLKVVDEDWLAVVRNLWKAQKSWTRLARILGWEGSSLRVSGMLFKAVVQEAILLGPEAWVLTPHMGRALGSF